MILSSKRTCRCVELKVKRVCEVETFCAGSRSLFIYFTSTLVAEQPEFIPAPTSYLEKSHLSPRRRMI